MYNYVWFPILVFKRSFMRNISEYKASSNLVWLSNIDINQLGIVLLMGTSMIFMLISIKRIENSSNCYFFCKKNHSYYCI